MNRLSSFWANYKRTSILLLLLVTVILGVIWWRTGVFWPSKVLELVNEAIPTMTKQLGEFNINEEKFSVDPSKLRGGGPMKDGIPAIDNPKFESAQEAAKWLKEGDLVFGIAHKGEARAYPQRILVWHEVINDTISDDPILISYCPLCGSAIAFERRVNGVEVEFGVSGRLYNSNLVMYSRANDDVPTESLWTQIGGEAIVGDLTGTKLKQLPLDTVTWGDWVTNHPNTKVLSRDTGVFRDYNRDPYEGYYTTAGLVSPVENTDDRLFEKAVVFGVVINGKAKAYPEEELKKTPKIMDEFAGKELEITRNADGSVQVRNITDGEEIIPTVNFWFSWAAFYPTTDLYK